MATAYMDQLEDQSDATKQTEFAIEDQLTYFCNGNKELSVEHNVNNDVEVMMSHLRKLNSLAPINRLPVELFTYIIFLVDPPLGIFRKPKQYYLPYTWVSSHWRSTLIETSQLWSSVELASGEHDSLIHPFIHELLQRSKTTGLDVTLSAYSKQFPSNLEAILAKESGRIRILRLGVQDEHLVQLVSDKCFPALQKLSYMNDKHGLNGLLPVLLSSNQLDTLVCTLLRSTPEDVVDRLVPTFSRIRNLHLDIHTFGGGELAPLFNLLHNSVNLQNLRIVLGYSSMINFSERLDLPELRYLSTDNPLLSANVFTPKLSSFCISYGDKVFEAFPESFDLSSIKYFYCIEMYMGHCIIGSNERIIQAESLIFPHTRYYVKGDEDMIPCTYIDSIDEAFSNNMLSNTFPRDRFCYGFRCGAIMIAALTRLHLLLSRMKNLKELYLPHSSLSGYKGALTLSGAPFVEKLVLDYSYMRLIEFIHTLSDPSLCPRLKHLFFDTICSPFIFRYPKKADSFPEEVGKTLTECVQSRHKAHGDRLKFIALHNCPPLPDPWLKELQKLGVTVSAKHVLYLCRSHDIN